MAGGHDHGEGIEVPDSMAVPAIELTAEPDAKSGHNLFIELADFTVAPERASTDPVDGEGHLHLYVDGERRMRFYNQALHLTGLDPGEHTIEVEVSANNHAAYTVDGVPIRAATTVTVPEPDDDGDQAGTSHGHGDAPLFDSEAAPSVALSITEDPKSGWNVQLRADGFEFTPRAVNAEPVDGEGHAHLYIDGQKITRLYGPWWHIAELPAGEHEVMVELSANDHSAYASDGAPIRAMASVTVDEADGAAMGGDSGEDGEASGDAPPSDGADVIITASLAGGDLSIAERRYEVDRGQTVGLRVESDVDEMIHIHGYDLLVPVGPGRPADVSFVADVPGSYEVELEESGRFLFDLQVNG